MGAMRSDDFFLDETSLGAEPGHRLADQDLIEGVRRGPVDGRSDTEVAVALSRLIHDELERFGTDGLVELNEEGIRLAIRALNAVTHRLGMSVQLPFRDYGSFRSWWVREGAKGSWQARRDLLQQQFDPIHDELAIREAAEVRSSLAEPLGSAQRTGWAAVDEEIGELRRHFELARTEQHFRNVGNDCVAVLEALSREIFNPSRHLREGESEPPIGKTKQRLQRVVQDAAPGSSNEDLRALARANIELAQHVKHSPSTQLEAGIAADAVIALAYLLRRLTSESG
jgi:hypothetical protein